VPIKQTEVTQWLDSGKHLYNTVREVCEFQIVEANASGAKRNAFKTECFPLLFIEFGD